ncbi:MAG: hypothetical protein WD749_13950, partial [Phycisphaerales bacterium]
MHSLAPAAHAQDTARGDDLSATTVFGWGNIIPGERWAPITVYLTAGDKPASGVIIVEFPQDTTQSARITAPFAATPNRTTPITVVAALSERCNQADITIITDDRRARRLRYSDTGLGNTIRMPGVLPPTQGVVLVVGRPSLPDAAREWPQFAATGVAGEEEPHVLEPGWGHLVIARADAGSLPPIPAAYDGLAAMVVDGDAALGIDPRILESVHQWVLGGGRLIIVADRPGDLWRAWLPPGVRSFVADDPPGVHPLPAEVAESIRRFAADLASPAGAVERIQAERRTRIQQQHYTPPGRSTVQPSTSKLPGPAETLAMRPLRLSQAARATGWRLAWALPGDGSAGALAEGPAGFGHITVLGLEPIRSTVVVSSRAAGAPWRDALTPAIADFLEGGWAEGHAYYGPQSRPQAAINSALESMATVPSIGGWVIIAFGAGLLLLVLLVGPVDYLVLRRLQAGQHWWLSSLAWIGLACAAAYAAPALIRTHPTQVSRLSVVDHLCDAPARPPGPDALTRATAITSVYAGESGVITPQTDPASWWRGVSAILHWYGRDPPRGLAPTFQGAAGGTAGSQRGNPLLPFAMPLWTFRGFLDQSHPALSLAARIRVTGEGDGAECRAFVTGLPEGCTVDAAQVRIGERRFTMDTPLTTRTDPATGVPIPILPSVPVGTLERGAWEATLPQRSDADTLWSPAPTPQPYTYLAAGYTPGIALSLAGPDRRTPAIERMLATGRYALILLQVRNCPPEPRIDRPAHYQHTR